MPNICKKINLPEVLLRTSGYFILKRMATIFRKRRRKLTEEEKLADLKCRPEWWWGDDSKDYWRNNKALVEVYSWEEDLGTQQMISEIEVGSL